MPLLFSYGTLRDPAVQQANFGRLLAGREDALPGYRVELVKITDPDVLAVSGQDHHPIVTPSGDLADQVPGTVFEVSDEELAAADLYEVDDYRRVLVQLASGDHAWVYVQAA
ncbi:hypothetical protein CS0771_28600 [Catellatospora sp. IY07-71]|uniref:gamma-glutamylcyclotransferase family protein n=1 Tax=Catellatospora sp. IY07-71 TaxID=2728827 RepID=UPI001BB31475|nr:gamma-glutamylcyclotransferase family protein [Catellatospora sp. IY07-71]BCJ73316.1 hypothetical protein CS0771_28600 [Catellatospora sp. IY07-71]